MCPLEDHLLMGRHHNDCMDVSGMWSMLGLNCLMVSLSLLDNLVGHQVQKRDIG